MIRGTTPTIRIGIKNIDLTQLEAFYLTFKQNNVVVEKNIDEVIIDEENSCVICKLTQEDTLKLNYGPAEMQIRLKDTAGLAFATTIKTIDVGKILKGGVI